MRSKVRVSAVLAPAYTALDLQEKQPEYMALSFDDRMNLAVDYTYSAKYNAKVHRLISAAKFRIADAALVNVYNDLELLSALAQLRIVGENQFYVGALEKRISIESLFGLKKEAKETMTNNVDDVYSITEKAPKLYSTREFSGTKL